MTSELKASWERGEGDGGALSVVVALGEQKNTYLILFLTDDEEKEKGKKRRSEVNLKVLACEKGWGHE